MTELEKLRATLCTVEKVREDVMEVRFGCKVSVSDLGMWMHRASTYTYEIIDIRNNNKEGADILDKIFLCSSRGWSHDVGSGYRPKEGFPRNIEILKKWEDKSIKVVKGDTFDDFKILGNRLQERHLYEYCARNIIPVSRSAFGELWILGKYITILDNDKDLEDQDEKTLGAINTFLTNT